jgi:hypothetical protein
MSTNLTNTFLQQQLPLNRGVTPCDCTATQTCPPARPSSFFSRSSCSLLVGLITGAVLLGSFILMGIFRKALGCYVNRRANAGAMEASGTPM